MMQYVSLYSFFESTPMRVIRIVFFLLLLALIIWFLKNHMPIRLPLFALLCAGMWKIFLIESLSRLYPKQTLDKTTNPLSAATMATLISYGKTPKNMAQHLLNLNEIVFFCVHSQIQKSEVQILDCDHAGLFAQAVTVARQRNGSYITPVDLFAAYLLMTEEKTKLLFAKKLKTEDVARITGWTCIAYPSLEHINTSQAITGDGFGEALVTGWTYETNKYTIDLTTPALRTPPLLFGRDEIFQQMLGALSQTQHNNVMLVGNAGSGKDTLISAFANQSFNGKVPQNLAHKRVLELSLGELLAGATTLSDLQERLQTILAEISHASVVIAIPEFSEILGSSSFHTDLSGTLLPYLKNGNVRIIATITPEKYKQYMEHSSLNEVFTTITLPTPDENTLFSMLFHKTLLLEAKSGVIISYQALKTAIILGNSFASDENLPGSSIKLIEATCAQAKFNPSSGQKTIGQQDVEKQIENDLHVVVSEPGDVEKDILLHLEEILHKRVIEQDEAITAIAQGMRRIRSNMSTKTKPISFLFLGPTGVGKTETAKTLADLYFGGEVNMLRYDMSEYSGPDGLQKLLGVTSGESGSSRGQLTEKVHDNPASLVLLDEFEKGSPAILDLFLQVLDDGRLTDSTGKTVSFVHCIIIATSNAGSEFIREQNPSKKALIEYLETSHIFKPELLNRFDEVITFKPLEPASVLIITQMLLQKLINTMQSQDIDISFDQPVIEKIATESFDPDFGARPIQRYIQDTLDDIIARQKLEGTLVRGTKAVFVLDQQGQINLQTS